jgi:hypothetical protein
MLATLATLTFKESRQITEVGALLGLIGGLALALAVLPFMRRPGLIVGGLLLAVGFGMIIYAVHYGVNPYHVVVVKK